MKYPWRRFSIFMHSYHARDPRDHDAHVWMWRYRLFKSVGVKGG